MLFDSTNQQPPKWTRQSFRCRLCAKRITEQYVPHEPKSMFKSRSQHLVAKHALHIDQFFAQFYRFEGDRVPEMADVGADIEGSIFVEA